MIYNESTKSFIKLETALKELGFDQQTIDLALEYLDITKPRNNDLMRKIITRYYPKLMQYSYREKLIKAVKSEISNSDSEELKDRYIIFSSMATGPYFRYMTEALSGNAYIYSENKAMYMKPLTDFYGENAEAVWISTEISHRSDQSIHYVFTVNPVYSADDAIRTFNFVSPDDIIAQLLLCVYALDATQLPKKSLLGKTKIPDTAEIAIKKLCEVVEKKPKTTTAVFCLFLAAYAEASYFAKEYRAFFDKNIVKYCDNLTQGLIYMKLSTNRIFDLIEAQPQCLTDRYILHFVKLPDKNGNYPVQMVKLAKDHPDIFIQTMKNARFDLGIIMEKMLKATDPNYDAKAVGLKAAQQEHISKNIAEHFKHRDEIYAYITGKAELDTILPFADEESCNGGHQNMNYVGEYGEDDFIIRCIAALSIGATKDTNDPLKADELEIFALEVLSRWLEKGAEAKTKWTMYFAAIYGGDEAINCLTDYIKEWSKQSLNMRVALAVKAVNAVALNGSSYALMTVDNISRKYKSRAVRAAAVDALANAAKQLGLTTQELADKIVPDMGFDEKMCRTFDFGSRKFSVYLTPQLDIEIFEGEKKLKNLPKIGVNDDPVLAEKATADFKEMKKQMKTVVDAQKQRLEYVLMLDRKWTAEAWKALFVKNPLMHCFAIGLIWGIYENGCLKTSFRYLDDGSFTNSDDDEIELSEVMQIGLVHPLELTEHEKEAWLEQLDDYEIIQPFDQLRRKVYKVAEIDKNKTACEIFKNTEITNTTLVNRMTKAGWYKGQAQDAGFFYEFIRNDISSKEKDPDGKLVNIGMTAELKFSGTYIGYYEIEDVTVEELYFRLPDAAYNDNMKLGDVNPRYYSEVVLQLKKAINK